MLSFGMLAVVVLDAESLLQGIFEAMCDLLQIILWNIVHGNHKDNSVTKYHQLLNKTQAITGKYCVSHDIFIQNMKTSQYTWNSA